MGASFGNGITYNLKLHESEYESMVALYRELGEMISAKMEMYINCLNDMTSYAVSEGELHDKLQVFLEAVQLYQDTFGNTCKEVVSKLEEFVNNVDELDGNIFGEYY